jgi:YYY domain-containing protein
MRDDRGGHNPLVENALSSLILTAAVLGGGALRLFNLNWDQGYLFHPDERMILMTIGGLKLPWPPDLAVLLSPESPLNPHFFAYGSLPLYLLKAVAHVLAFFQANLSDFEHIRLIGRGISGIFDTGLILLVFLLGKTLFDRRVGLLAAVFVAFTVLHIQLSHFYTVDTLLTFFIMLAMLCAVQVMRRGSLGASAWMGICLGLALATKVSVAPLALTAGVAWLLWVARGERPAGYRGHPWRRGMAGVALAGVLALVVFVIGEPYAVLDWENFIKRIVEESNMVRGIADLPYTRQYIGTPAYLYQIWNTIVWGMGIPLGIVAFGGLGWAVIRGVARRRNEELLLLSWVLIYFLITGSFMVKFLRYMLPLVPFLCLLGAAALVSLKDWLASRGWKWSRGVLPGIAALVVLPTILYAVAFVNIYAQTHPWIQISEWIYANLPSNSVLATEHWDDRLPLGMTIDKNWRTAESFGHRDMANYEEDNAVKLNWMVENIRSSTVIVLATNRLYGSIASLPDRYPLTTAYYQLLFAEKLGFRLVDFAATYPSLGGVTLVDDTFSGPRLPVPPLLANFQPSSLVLNLGRADESFTVYDHPKPMVFQKVQQLSAEELRALLEPAMRRTEELRAQRLRKQAADRQGQGGGQDQGKSLLLSEQDRLVQEAGGTFSQMFDAGALANRVPVLAWWLVVELLGLVAFPIAFSIFKNLDDRGYFFAKSVGILVLGYLVWLAASLRFLPYTWTSIVLMLGLLAAVSLRLFLARRQAMIDFLRRERHLILLAEALFLTGYLLFCFIRLLNPDLWQPWLGGEKPMEFAFLNAIIKSTYFPPYDPYFAGGTINYYYYGQYLVATLIKLTGILPSVAFNLAVPTLFSLTVVSVFGVAYNLMGGHREDKDRPGPAVARNARLWYSLVAGFFVAVVGNLNGMVQLVEGFSKNSSATFQSAIPGLEGAVLLVTGLVATLSQRLPLPSFDYWRSTRLIPNTINEFPFFSYLFADLHAHMIGIPFTVLTLALALNLAKGGRPRDSGEEADEPAGVGVALLGLFVFAVSLGALAAINSWDVPTYLGILLCALVIREWSVNRQVRPLTTLARFVAIAGLSLLLYVPFFQNYQALSVGIGLTTVRTTLADYWQMFGIFLFLLSSYLVVEGLGGPEPFARGARLAVRRWEQLPRVVRLRGALNVVTTDAAWADGTAPGEAGSPPEQSVAAPTESPPPWGLWIFGWAAVVSIVFWLAGLHVVAALLPLLALTAALAWRRGQSPETLFTLLLVFTGLLISVGVEVVYLKDFLGSGDYHRMNTLFKFYIQVWVFLGIASAVALARLSGSFNTALERALSPTLGRTPTPLKVMWWGVLAVLLLSVAVYPLAGTAARINDRFPGARPQVGTLDGMAFMTVGTYTWENKSIELKYDYDAIEWLLRNVKGSPVVAEAAIGYYREFGVRVASFTGLPTLLGMHQSEQRYDTQVGQRDGEARTLFTEPDYARVADLAKRLHITYIYVGQLERVIYPAAGLTKFDRAVGSYLDMVYENPRTKIYQVR